MADFYTQFSSGIGELTKEEAEWCDANLHDLTVNREDTDDPLEFEWRLEKDASGTFLWLHDCGDYGNVEQVADFVQSFLIRWRPKEVWYMSWACTCSKPRIDSFDGGAVVVTAKKTYYVNASTWAHKKSTSILARRKANKPKGKRHG